MLKKMENSMSKNFCKALHSMSTFTVICFPSQSPHANTMTFNMCSAFIQIPLHVSSALIKTDTGSFQQTLAFLFFCVQGVAVGWGIAVGWGGGLSKEIPDTC